MALFLPLVSLGACGASSHSVASPSGEVQAGAAAPAPLNSADIDAFFRSEWQKRGAVPSGPIDDATFLRRAHLDIVGVIPTAERVTAFLADPAPSRDKRARAVAELLASPGYAEHWTIVWDDLLMGPARAGELDRAAFRVWLHDQFDKNVPWNKVAASLVGATGVQSAGKEGGKSLAAVRRAVAENPQVSGAVNYPLRFRDAPQDFAGNASKVFLGTQVQCAQCHDHKTEKLTQTEFQSFASCFSRVAFDRVGTDPKGGRFVAVRDADRASPKLAADTDVGPIAKAAPRALDGTPVTGNVRQGIAAWMVQSPLFSRAIVNRMWGHFLGRGFTNPVDDMRPSNPPEAAALLDRIADDFARNGHDLKRLIALISAAEVYQLSPTAPAGAAAEAPLWSRYRMVPLGAEELASSLLVATGAGESLGRRTDPEELRFKLTKLFSFTFDVDEEFEQTKYEGTLAQALVLLNGRLTAFGANATGQSPLAAIAGRKQSDAEAVEALFLRILSRKPTASESEKLTAYVSSPPPVAATDSAGASAKRKKDPLGRLPGPGRSKDPRSAALEDIAWALLNTSEFALNH